MERKREGAERGTEFLVFGFGVFCFAGFVVTGTSRGERERDEGDTIGVIRLAGRPGGFSGLGGLACEFIHKRKALTIH